MAANEDFRAARGAQDPYVDEPEEEELFDDEQPPRRSSRVLPIVVASLAILGFVVIVYYAYQQGIRAGSEQNPPIIKADEGPTKVRPASPGGMEVPNQGMKVYELGKPGAQTAASGPERILPKPEEPMQRPKEPPPAPEATLTQPAATTGAATAGLIPTIPGSATLPGGLPPLSMITGTPLAAGGAVSTPPPPPLPSAGQTATPPRGASTDSQAATAAPRASGPSVPAPPPPAAPPRDTAPAASAPAPSRGGIALGAARPAPPAAPAPTQQAAAPAPAAQPAIPPIATTPASGGTGSFAVQLMAGKTQEEVEAAWTRIRGKNQDLLGPMNHEVQIHQDARGTFYRLRVISFATREDADKLCSALKARKQDCLVPR